MLHKKTKFENLATPLETQGSPETRAVGDAKGASPWFTGFFQGYLSGHSDTPLAH